jgi:hypothetical protein
VTRGPIAQGAASVAVLICSSDGRRDVLTRVLPSLRKFWPDCPYPIYVGLNSACDLGPKIETLIAPPSEWRKECREQVVQITASHLIVVLDDFLIQAPVDQAGMDMFVEEAIRRDLPYLRLMPLGRSLVQRVVDLFRPRTRADIREIEEGRPFYSGLQIAIWNKAHFLALLESTGSIWDFEHRGRPDSPHYAITGRQPILYSHLVEKGRWLPYAKTLLSRAGLPSDLGKRQSWPSWMSVRMAFDKIRFYVIGYANH